ncbi:MAG: FtsX-like permease family protein, partial [Bacteroidaceae bacterium]|nr:FtsX-like permease family protein [Bacteroidaceae bacterium]
MKALRNLYITLRSMPVVTGLNIFGLAVAISVAYMIFVQVNHELGFNKGIKDADRTALIISDGDFMGERTIHTNMSRGAVEFIRNSVPMVEKVGSINILGNRRGGCTEDNPEGFLFNVSNILYPATTLEMFGFELVEGDTASLATYGNMAVSESFAHRHNLKLGSRIGHTYNEDIPLYNEAYWKGTVTAIYRDFPENCDLATLDAIGFFDRNDISDWSNWNFQVYVKLADGYTFAQFDSTLTKLFVEEQARIKRDGDPKRYFTVPVSELYYNQPAEIKYSFPSSKGDLSTTLSLAAIAVVLLLVAFINYLNFVMSLIPMRTRSVNTQRIMGASVESLRLDFIAESFLFLLAAVVPALFIVAVVGKSDLSSLFITSVDVAEHWDTMLGIVVAGVLLSLFVSLYPAFYITSFSPAFALNGNFGRGKKGIALRTLLIGVQFFVCFVLIVAALFIWLQNRYLMSADMGFNREHLLTVELPQKQYFLEGQTPRDELADKLMQGGYVKDVAFSNGEFIANRRWTV